MKRVYVNEDWCLGCHLCEYICAFSNASAGSLPKEYEMSKLLKGLVINPNIRIEEKNGISFAVQCRHCEEPLCVKSCISGALTIRDGAIRIDKNKCVGCYTCVTACPYGAISASDSGAVQKCELCLNNSAGTPLCVKNCPNAAIVFEERSENAVL